MNLVDVVNKNYLSKNVEKFPAFKAGDSVSVSVRIKEGNKSRIQKFDGTVIAMKGGPQSIDGHFRVRKISSGYGVERVFPFHSPNVEAVKVLNKGKVRRAKHFYLRDRTGKAARIETDYTSKK
ncbi:MAG: 50S ribosomal protein L19 [Bacteriovoracaceae bacterium]|jgi:large subunit ribosomal protein L19|nr:50S ribosomal protein L19 [Halobacteriovoraceae bacterium]MDP7319214.1 50S ribosomal protein L19 [Bacteriovoracaceae bacterium]|tara:strand:+ start:96 stop:464 length:369 start_codon:yes stop_codon:yes gene_type:complete